MPTQEFRKYHLNKLSNKEEARIYLEVALEEYEKDQDSEAFFQALKDVTEAQGGMTKLARATDLNRQNLYKVMSGENNPRLETISHILHGLGFQLSLKAMPDNDKPVRN